MDISSMLEVQVKEEMDIKENVTPMGIIDQAPSTTTMVVPSISQEETNFYKLMFGNDISSVRYRRLHCTACDMHIGSAPAQSDNMFQHPVLRTLLCANCREFYGDGSFEQGDDATDMFCRWCANGGNLYCCSYCSNTFCYKCIRRNFTAAVRKKIEAEEKWKCFVCHPSDLYSARAICWALLEHVKIMTRILKNDESKKKLGAAEVERRMNLDESPCCPRKRKRKRRRQESNSEEEDETFVLESESNGLPVRKQTRNVKVPVQAKVSPNGNIQSTIKVQSIPIPIRPRPSSFLTGSSQPATQSGKTDSSIASSSEGIILPSSSMINSNTPLPPRYDSNVIQPSLYHTTFMNSAGSNTYIRAPVTVTPPNQNRLILSASSLSTPQSPTPYHPSQTQSSTPYQKTQSHQAPQNTMVSIPNPTDKHGRSLFLLPKPRKMNLTLTPNIIDVDSDSDDDPKVIEQQNKSTTKVDEIDIVDAPLNKVVPVALTWENSDDDSTKEEQSLREISTTLTRNDPSFCNVTLPHIRKLQKLLYNVREKVSSFFEIDSLTYNIDVATQLRVNQFCCNMRNTVLRMANINDRIVREYYEWRRSRNTETQMPASINENELASQEDIEIPLDMICTHESDTESDYEGLEYKIKRSSELVKIGNIIEDVLFSKKKTVTHRGTGDDNVHLSDKATQVYSIPRDYEKCISYSVVTKPNDEETDNSALEHEISTPDKNFGKYEEQFIFYLQHIEDHGIQTEDISLADSDDIPLQELIETNSPFISHLFQNTDLSDNIISDELSDHINMNEIIDPLKSVINDDQEEILKNLNSDIKLQETNDIRIQETILLDEKLRKTQNNKTDEEITSIMSSNEDANSNTVVNNMVNMNPSTSKGNENDYTIIDD